MSVMSRCRHAAADAGAITLALCRLPLFTPLMLLLLPPAPYAIAAMLLLMMLCHAYAADADTLSFQLIAIFAADVILRQRLRHYALRSADASLPRCRRPCCRRRRHDITLLEFSRCAIDILMMLPIFIAISYAFLLLTPRFAAAMMAMPYMLTPYAMLIDAAFFHVEAAAADTACCCHTADCY